MAMSKPAGQTMRCIYWQYRYRADPNVQWDDTYWGTLTDSYGKTQYRLTGIWGAGYYQMRAINGDADYSDAYAISPVVEVRPRVSCCAECGPIPPCQLNMTCINGKYVCSWADEVCINGECIAAFVYITHKSPIGDQVVNCPVTFTAETIPSGYESSISWSGGENPETGSGGSFTTSWSTAGEHTVTAVIHSCDGHTSRSNSESANIIEFTVGHTYEWLRDHCANPIQNPNNPPNTNHCSMPGLGDCPSLIGCDYCFTEACDQHDYCYSTCHPNLAHKEVECDYTLCENIVTMVCDFEDGICAGDCLMWAGLFATGVDTFGMSDFEDAQEEVCACKDCKK